jgi:hypothetical protein
MSYIGSNPITQNFIAGTDYFNGTGSAVNFTLSRAVNSVNDIEVLVNNVAQIPSGYLVSGTTLTFSVAPSAGTSNVYVRYLSTTNLSIAPGQATVGPKQLSATGTPSASTYLRGDNTWSTVNGGVTSLAGGNGIAVSSSTGAITVSAIPATANTIGTIVMAYAPSAVTAFSTTPGTNLFFLNSVGAQVSSGCTGTWIHLGPYSAATGIGLFVKSA